MAGQMTARTCFYVEGAPEHNLLTMHSFLNLRKPSPQPLLFLVATQDSIDALWTS